MIKHETDGEFQYDKVYFGLDDPVLFIGHFENKPALSYIGFMMENFDGTDFGCPDMIKNYWFVRTNQEQTLRLESGEQSLADTLIHSPAMWLSHHSNGDKEQFRWMQYQSMNPLYTINPEITLT